MTTQEAVLSSKIEGTQATLEEVLRYEANPNPMNEKQADIKETINYREAMIYAKEEVKQKGISLNLLRRTHNVLLESVRGQNRDGGNFRGIQNWIGKQGTPIEQARFVPPSPMFLMNYLSKSTTIYDDL